VKFLTEGLFGDLDVSDVAYSALSARPPAGAPSTGPVPSPDVSIPSSEPSTPAGDTAPDLSGPISN
jgi:hypothetical protein